MTIRIIVGVNTSICAKIINMKCKDCYGHIECFRKIITDMMGFPFFSFWFSFFNRKFERSM